MFKEKDIVRVDIVYPVSTASRRSINICLCKTCKKEIKVEPSRMSTMKGECYSCSRRKKTERYSPKDYRHCSYCNKDLLSSKFPKNTQSKSNKSRCNKCLSLKTNFNLTFKDFEQMLLDHNNKCAICKRSEKLIRNNEILNLSIDHCHTTGKIRGLLCNNCNRGLGMFEDNKEFLLNAVNYLK